MSSAYSSAIKVLQDKPKTWLITGVAGFIGSHLLERLLKLNQTVVGFDNFSTGKRENLDEVRLLVSPVQWSRFTLHERDIRNLAHCQEACRDVDIVLHEAALGSVPRSLEDPLNTNDNNITGTLNMFISARDCKVKRFVYAASSSTYGDHPGLPKTEDRLGKPLSPYAVTKYVNELYADVFSRCYGLETIGLRYFNIFGPRQDPDGAYAAVVPKWISSMIRNDPVHINGTGETSRDFTFIENAVQMNILAALTDNRDAVNQVYNTALNARTTLNELFMYIRSRLASDFEHVKSYEPLYRDFRPGDVKHSQADINKAKRLLGYAPTHTIEQGLDEAVKWYKDQMRLSELRK